MMSQPEQTIEGEVIQGLGAFADGLEGGVDPGSPAGDRQVTSVWEEPDGFLARGTVDLAELDKLFRDRKPYRPDPELEAECLAAFDRGERTTLAERIVELQEDIRQQQRAAESRRRARWRKAVCGGILWLVVLGLIWLAGQCWGAG